MKVKSEIQSKQSAQGDKLHHSPVPWSVEVDYPDSVLDAEGSVVVCTSPHGDYNNPVNKANANLIAAAPELLEALEALHSLVDFDEPVGTLEPIIYEDPSAINAAYARARAAMHKARGVR